jgi:hypothetical protein
MNHANVDRVADALLYEGYLLYPYRPSSVKNRTRWTFGGLFPRAWTQAHGDAEPCTTQAECLLKSGTRLSVRVRFLHLIQRPDWQEAAEREVAFAVPLAEVQAAERRVPFTFGPGRDERGGVVRTHERIEGEVTVAATRIGALTRLTLRVANLTPLDPAVGRGDAQRHAMASTHAILHAAGGEFVSQLDPPDECRPESESCRNVGLWPVLAGPEGTADTMLASPIILYDHPQVAPESPGDLFDATEIDEILSLRILTLTDEEKQQMRATDNRARRLLERTESLGGDQLLALHGALRRLSRHE